MGLLLPRWIKLGGRLALSREARADSLYEWRRRRRGEPELPGAAMERILVVCHGNICRSPFAGALLQQHCPELEVRSAGFGAGEGDPAQGGALRVSQSFGIDLAAHRAHRMGEQDVDWADLILGMEGHHVTRVAQAWPAGRERTRLLGDYLSEPPHRIADPWGQSDEIFEECFRRIRSAVDRLSLLLRQPERAR